MAEWNTYAALFQPWQETVITTTYDPLYRLTAATYHGSLNANYQYQYDAVGNITQLTETVDGQTTTTTRTFNPANQLLTADDGQLDTTFGYDNAGNLVQKDTPATYETLWYRYDQRHLLIAAGSMSLGEIYTNTLITYDGAGHRLQLTQGGTTTTYTLDYAGGMRVLYEQGGAFADTKHYLYGLACIAELVNADDPNTKKWRYYHQDGQPLVRQTTDEQGHITLAWGYFPSGATLYGEEGPVTNLDCGAIYDWGTGLIYKNGNYFDPNLQTWLSFAPLVVWQAWISQQKKRQRTGKRNKRWLILPLLILLTIIALVGCSSTSSSVQTPVMPPPTCTPTPLPPTSTPIPRNQQLVLEMDAVVLYDYQYEEYSDDYPGFYISPSDYVPASFIQANNVLRQEGTNITVRLVDTYTINKETTIALIGDDFTFFEEDYEEIIGRASVPGLTGYNPIQNGSRPIVYFVPFSDYVGITFPASES